MHQHFVRIAGMMPLRAVQKPFDAVVVDLVVSVEVFYKFVKTCFELVEKSGFAINSDLVSTGHYFDFGKVFFDLLHIPVMRAEKVIRSDILKFNYPFVQS